MTSIFQSIGPSLYCDNEPLVGVICWDDHRLVAGKDNPTDGGPSAVMAVEGGQQNLSVIDSVVEVTGPRASRSVILGDDSYSLIFDAFPIGNPTPLQLSSPWQRLAGSTLTVC